MSRIEGNSETVKQAMRRWGGEAVRFWGGAQRINYSRRGGSVTSFCCKKWEVSPRQTGNTALAAPTLLVLEIEARAGKQVNSIVVLCCRAAAAAGPAADCGAARLANDCTTFCPTTTQYANTAGQISKMLNMHLQAGLVIWAKLVMQNKCSSSRS